MLTSSDRRSLKYFVLFILLFYISLVFVDYDELSRELGQDDSGETLPLMFLRSPEKRMRKGTGVKYHRCYHNPVSCF